MELSDEIEDVKRLDLKPTDIVVIRVASALSMERIAHLAHEVKQAIPDNRVLVLDSGMGMYLLGEA